MASPKLSQEICRCLSKARMRPHFPSICTRRKMASLTLETLNPRIKIMQYAVRGALVIRANEIEKELRNGVKKPFTQVVRANLGDCHAMGQAPITFIRQVLALVTYPVLFNDPHFPPDARKRAKKILGGCRGGSVGSYSHSAGLEVIRKQVATYIEKRDGGVASHWENVFLCSGASDGIKNILKLLICDVNGKKGGIMVPIPQYPLYSATLAEFNLHQIGYYLDESKNWELNVPELQKVIDDARKVSHPRAIVVINPGNPTGQVLARHNIEEIIKFAEKENLFILADEVYQDNVYAEGSEFFSFKKVATEMGKPYSEMEVASFMSCSKCYMGECGLRGGYTEIINMDPQVKAMYLKLISANLCPTVLGQTAMYVTVYPPEEGEPSYELFNKEVHYVLDSLKKRAKFVGEMFRTFEGFTCDEVQGSMYAFPQIKLPPKAIEEAKKRNMAPDEFYAFELLENTGVCIVPGTGFGQKPGTYHFRTTILPHQQHLSPMLYKFKDFHEAFVKKYS